VNDELAIKFDYGSIVMGEQPDICSIYDRKIKLSSFDDDSSLYSLLRAWVQDDIYRNVIIVTIYLHISPEFFENPQILHNLFIYAIIFTYFCTLRPIIYTTKDA